MKIRWSEHEAVLVRITATALTGKYVYDMIHMSSFSVDYICRILLPQLITILLLYLAYVWLNRRIVPLILSKIRNLPTAAWAILQLLLLAYLLGPILNFAAYFLMGNQQTSSVTFPLAFGNHPQPLVNTFGGLTFSLFFIILYLLYAVLRELAIRHLERDRPNRPMIVTMANETTLFLIALFALPIFTSTFELVREPLYYHFYYACLLPTQAVFLCNKYFLFPLKGSRSFYSWQIAGPLLFFSYVCSLLFSFTLGSDWSILAVNLIWAIQVLFVIPISWLDYLQHRDRVMKLRGVEQALVKSTADLQFLRMQINPHFLFNALNTIYGTALTEGAHRTAESTLKLGDMMRFMIHENTMDFIPLDKEINYLQSFIDLQRLRVQNTPDISIDTQIENNSAGLRIVPMLLIPLAENAFKHGIDLAEKSHIRMQLNISGRTLHFEVRNSLHTVQDGDYEKDHSGIGLSNVKERLQIFYPGKHEFSCAARADEFVCTLVIDL
jgi:two-component system LytT family sensor kinase